MSDCNECPDPSCACPLPACADTLIIGSVPSYPNTDVFVHIVKANGAQHIEQVTTDGNGVISLPLDSPSASFYNPYDGTYIMFVMLDGYFCEDDKLTVTTGDQTWTTVAVEFQPSAISYTTINLEITT